MRNCECICTPPMFQSRVSGVGTPVARTDDGTETEFYPAGLQYRFQSTPIKIVLDNGVPRMVEGPPEGPVRMYELQVTVKNYVPGSGQVSYTTWGRGLYPGFNPTPNWKTVSEAEFISMYPDWVAVRNAKFGTPAPAPSPAGGSALPLIMMQMSKDRGTGPGNRLQVCPPVCPEGYVPPGKSPPTDTAPTPKPTGSALPLIIGAALLLLS